MGVETEEYRKALLDIHETHIAYPKKERSEDKFVELSDDMESREGTPSISDDSSEEDKTSKTKLNKMYQISVAEAAAPADASTRRSYGKSARREAAAASSARHDLMRRGDTSPIRCKFVTGKFGL